MADEKKATKNEEAEEMNAEQTVQNNAESTEEKEGIITLNKPYVFEGKEYKTIDLSGIEKLTINDAIKAQSQLIDEQEVAAALATERTTAFARLIATKASDYPIEFFKLMPRGVMKRTQRAVVAALAVTEESEDHILKFNKPYTFEGKEYTEIDLNGIANMTSMNESEAENRLVRAGITITEPTFNYLYACIMASMATGQPEKFFTGLPIGELLKLKAEVNSSDFFE